MARKKEGWFELLVALPWWVSIFVSGSAYIGLTYIGLTYIAPNITTNNIILQSIFNAAPSLSPLIPFVLLIPAPISAFTSWRKGKLLDNQKNIETIRDLTWREFEELVAEAYRRQGYTVIENQSAGADGGIDIRLMKDNHTHLVQCKNWKTIKVGVKVVREMYGVMTAEHAFSAIIIISGVFTQEAKNFASDKPIDLIDGSQLEKLIVNIQASPTRVSPAFNGVEEQGKICPRCNGTLILRTARKGKNAGDQFLGCSSYPKCRYTQSV